jgi:hypothetical protein
MMRFCLLPFLIFLCGTSFAQKNTVRTLDKTSFLREILGARYAKSDRAWTMPATQAVTDTFGVEATGGLFVGVDTIAYREVYGQKEAWVLFTVEGYMFNFARLIKTPAGWTVQNMHYRLHEGAHGEYAPLAFYIQMIGQKTFISIQEDWHKRGIITTNWVLYDPLSAKKAGKIELARVGEKERSPEQFTEISFLQVKYESVQEPLPDIMLTQFVDSKKKGAVSKTTSRTLRYRWDEKLATFIKVGK